MTARSNHCRAESWEHVRGCWGVGIVGAGAGEIIAKAVLAIEMGAVARDVLESIHQHPTLSETVMESAEMAYGTATHVGKPRKR